MKILFKLTTKGRPEWMFRAIDSILNNIDDKENYFITIVVDENDETINEERLNNSEWRKSSKESIVILKFETRGKIDAINKGVKTSARFFDWNILVNVSDDQVFTVKGFDNIIRNQFKKYDNELNEIGIDLDRFIHFPDGNRTDLCTMSIIGRKYYDRDGYIYNPEYTTESADEEAQEVAKLRGCYRFVNQVIALHLHPNYGKAPIDQTYIDNSRLSDKAKDAAIFIYRKANKFFLTDAIN